MNCIPIAAVMSAHQLTDGRSDDFGPVHLPPLRTKRKLFPDRYVQFDRVTPHKQSDPPKQHRISESLPTPNAGPHVTPGMPSSLSTTIKFAEIVHRNWSSTVVLPAVLSAKATSKFLYSAHRNTATGSERFKRRHVARLSSPPSKWYEKASIMGNIASFCTTERLATLFTLNKDIHAVMRTDRVWSQILDGLRLTPLLKFHGVSSEIYTFFTEKILTTDAVKGFYGFEGVREPSRRSFSFQTDTLPSDVSREPADDTSTSSMIDDLADKIYRQAKLRITSATFGGSSVSASRCHLLLRKWPPFDQCKVYSGSCRFSLDSGFVFTFLSEGMDSQMVYSTTVSEHNAEVGKFTVCFRLIQRDSKGIPLSIPLLILEDLPPASPSLSS